MHADHPAGSAEREKSLVDEFAQFSRFPSAQPVAGGPERDRGKRDGRIRRASGRTSTYRSTLDRTIPSVMADREQMKRVIVNLSRQRRRGDERFAVPQIVYRNFAAIGGYWWSFRHRHGLRDIRRRQGEIVSAVFSTKDRGTGPGARHRQPYRHEHHGRVRVEDNRPHRRTLCRGAEWLPSGGVGLPPPMQSESAPALREDIAFLKCLHGDQSIIVDDEANIRQSLRGVLGDENYHCTAVESGEACLD